MTKIIKTENGYAFEADGKRIENLKVVFDKRKNCGDIQLPENEYGKKWLSESRFADGITEIDLGNMPRKSASGSVKSTVVHLNWIDYIADEDLAEFTKIKEKALVAMNKAQKIAEIEKMQAMIANLEKELGLN